MAHGYAGVREHGIAKFAEAFADAGFVVLLHDHRTFGVSGGEPRQDVDPWRQIADWRRAISYLESRPEVDSSRIGLWGTSYAGGCWAPPTDVLLAWSPRCRRSADTSKVFVTLHQRPFPPWRRR
jgi:dienelactone hydrolase